MPIWPISRRGQGALIAALLATQAVPAFADRDPRTGAPTPPERQNKVIASPITDRFYIEGIFYPFSVSTSLRLDPSNGAAGVTGTTVSAERDLGLVSRLYQGRMEMMLRLRERNRLRVDYQQVDRSASHYLGSPIQFGNNTFLPNQQADTSLAWRMFTLTYTYSLYRSDWLEIGAGLAAHMIEAQAHGQVLAEGERTDVSAASGFPTVPLDFTWRISRRFALTGRGQYFRASSGTFSGALTDAHGDFQYRWTPNFALGIGYSLTRFDVDTHSRSFPGTLSIYVKGEEAFFRVSL
jgi:hypothetical protein